MPETIKLHLESDGKRYPPLILDQDGREVEGVRSVEWSYDPDKNGGKAIFSIEIESVPVKTSATIEDSPDKNVL
ncbi:MAG TPA: hypothetical protein VGB17_19270 [Pyrinomonadaceae bacterium]|jgi:hypothetical protein